MLRREFAARKPAHVPDAPTHASCSQPPPAAPSRRRGGRRHDHPHARRGERRARRSRRPPGCSPTGSPPRPRRRCASAGWTAEVDGGRAARARATSWSTPCSPGSRAGAARGRATRWSGADGLIAVTPDRSRVLQRAVQAVLRRRWRTARSPGSRPGRRHRRHRAALAGPGARGAPAVRLPARASSCRPRCSPRRRTGRAAPTEVAPLDQRIARAAGELADLVAGRPARDGSVDRVRGPGPVRAAQAGELSEDTLIVAPVGSAIWANRPYGVSSAGCRTLPPSRSTFASAASTSAQPR